MNILKIKFEGERTNVTYEENIENGLIQKEIIFKTDTERHSDFTAAANDLIPLAVSLLGLPMDYKEGIEFRGVTFSNNEHQGMGAVVTMLKYIDGINSPFVMNTPHMHNAEDGNSIMSTPYRKALEHLIKEAEMFLQGKRAQGDLFIQPVKKAANS